MRAKGVKVGLLIIKVFRPFPHERVQKALHGKEVVGVMERVPVFGTNVGPMTMEVTQSLFDLAEPRRPKLVNFIYGLGGRPVGMDTIGKALNILDVIRLHSPKAHYRKVYHLDVRDTREEALLSPEHVDEIYYQPVKNESIDIRMYARGGEGIKTASKILASAAIEAGGKYALGFSVYGAERSGAPTQGYVRIGDEAINARTPITYSDIDIFVNPGLLNAEAIQGLKYDGTILVNSPLSPEEIRKKFDLKGRDIYTVDAYRIAQEEIGDSRKNSIAMLGALMGITRNVLDIDDLLENIENLPFGSAMVGANKRAAMRAYSEWLGEEEKTPNTQGEKTAEDIA
jgi:pyruvate ferredoxin oxidoreductase gamma subunit